MKFVIVFVAFVAICTAAPADIDHRSASTVQDSRSNNLEGYRFNFETSNGIQREESGELKQIDDNAAIVQSGTISWTSPEGIPVQLRFTADENGYHPIV